jgi:multimeric flavodoxin WrbA
MSSKHVLILKGSPRLKGNSAKLADRLAVAAQEAGAQVESFALQMMDIQACTACDACQDAGNGSCTIQDDMRVLYPKLLQADAIVIASPIYWFNVSAQTKLLIDRLYAFDGPRGNALAGKRVGIILTYADVDPMSSGAVNAVRMYQDMFRYIKAEIVGMVYGTASQEGEIPNEPALLEQARKLGHALATGA